PGSVEGQRHRPDNSQTDCRIVRRERVGRRRRAAWLYDLLYASRPGRPACPTPCGDRTRGAVQPHGPRREESIMIPVIQSPLSSASGRPPFTILIVDDDPHDTERMLHAIEEADLRSLGGTIDIQVRARAEGALRLIGERRSTKQWLPISRGQVSRSKKSCASSRKPPKVVRPCSLPVRRGPAKACSRGPSMSRAKTVSNPIR